MFTVSSLYFVTEIYASLTDRNLKLEFDKINKNLKLFLYSLRENRASLKNLQEELDFLKHQNIVELDKISRIEKGRLELKQIDKA